MTIGSIITLAVLIEATVETIKPIWDKEKGWNVSPLVALGISIAVCVLSGADLFSLVGSPLAVPYAGSVFTGIIVSRGANFLHDLWPQLTGVLNILPALQAKTAPLIVPGVIRTAEGVTGDPLPPAEAERMKS